MSKTAKMKKPWYKKVWVWIIVALVLIIGFAGGEDAPEVENTIPTASVVESTNPFETEANATETSPSESETPELTIGQKNAVRKAESYLDLMAFSRSGLIEQLEYEGFSTEDATFAVDYIEVDWNEQAALKAESYLGLMAFSADGLAEQLEYEGFTDEQIAYALKAVGY